VINGFNKVGIFQTLSTSRHINSASLWKEQKHNCTKLTIVQLQITVLLRTAEYLIELSPGFRDPSNNKEVMATSKQYSNGR